MLGVYLKAYPSKEKFMEDIHIGEDVLIKYRDKNGYWCITNKKMELAKIENRKYIESLKSKYSK